MDGAMVFAASSEHEFQNGKPEFGATCLSDAVDLYVKVVAALPTANVTGAQLQDLKAKLIRLKRLLDGLRSPMRNEAA